MALQIRSQGRELTVKFTCYRCSKFEFLPYDKVIDGECYGYLHNSKLPEGWDSVGYGQILCPTCTNLYKLFMGGGE